MRRRADDIVDRARDLIGTKFRPQGRTAVEGLDCVGLVALVLDVRTPPRDYALRGGCARRLSDALAAAGLKRRRRMVSGDVLVLAPGPGQMHLGIFTGTGIVHADAGLRRVVERPLPLPWPMLGIWR